MENIVEQLKPKDWEERKDVNEDVESYKKILHLSLAKKVRVFLAISVGAIVINIMFLNSTKLVIEYSYYAIIAIVLSIMLISRFVLNEKLVNRNSNEDENATKSMNDLGLDDSSSITFDPVYNSFDSNIYHDDHHD